MKALLDTGSMNSTILLHYCPSRSFEIRPLERLFTVESISGHTLLYLGFVEVGVQEKVFCALMLGVPNAPYKERIPVLLGNNVHN